VLAELKNLLLSNRIRKIKKHELVGLNKLSVVQMLSHILARVLSWMFLLYFFMGQYNFSMVQGFILVDLIVLDELIDVLPLLK